MELKDNIKYFIVETNHVMGDSILLWGPNGGGYTINLDRAGRYDKEEAQKLARLRKGSYAVECSIVESLAIRVVDRDHTKQIIEKKTYGT